MSTAGWTAVELARLGAARELRLAPRRADGSLHRSVRVWAVRVGDDLYVRSWLGEEASWFRAVRATGAGRIRAGEVQRNVGLEPAGGAIDDAVDAGYRAKYGPTGSRYVEPMVEPPARGTTLRLVPRA